MKTNGLYKLTKTLRKIPKQKRSSQLVDSILASAARVLIRTRYEGLNTNLIAETAGVSIGSLYQYFPNKEAILLALIDKHIESDVSAVLKCLEDVLERGLNLEASLREILAVLIQAYSCHRELRKIFITEVPKVGKLQRIIEVENEVGTLIFERLLKPFTSVADQEMVQFVIIKGIVGVIRSAALERAAYLDQSQLIEELVFLTRRYIERP